MLTLDAVLRFSDAVSEYRRLCGTDYNYSRIDAARTLVRAADTLTMMGVVTSGRIIALRDAIDVLERIPRASTNAVWVDRALRDAYDAAAEAIAAPDEPATESNLQVALSVAAEE